MQKECDEVEWIGKGVARGEDMSITTLQAANRALKAEVLTTNCSLQRYVEMEHIWKSELQDAKRWEFLWVSISVCIFAAYVSLLSSTLT